MENNNRVGEFEFDMRTIIKQILWKWKGLLVFVVAGAILLPVCVDGMRESTDVKSIDDISLTTEEELQIQRYYLADTLLRAQEIYIEENQGLLNVSPEEANAYTICYIITECSEPIENVKSAYYTKIIEDRDIVSTPTTLEEIYTTSKWDNVLVINQTETNRNELCFKVYQYEDATILKLQEDILEISKELSDIGLEHKLLVIEEKTQSDYDYQLAAFQKSVLDEYKTLKSQKNTESNTLSESALRYIDFQINGRVTAAEMSKKDILVYAFIGAFAGLMLVVMYVVVRYVCSKSPNTAMDVQNIFGIKFLGKIESTSPRKTDVLVDKIFGDREKVYLDDESIKRAINTTFDSDGLGKVAVVDYASLDASIDICSICGEKSASIKFENIEMSSIDVEGKGLLQSYDGVVVIVKKNATLYKDINAFVSFCQDCKVKLLGYLVVE